MRIIILHNRYVYSGGEDSVVAAESDLLREYGHDVRLVEADNRTIRGALDQIRVALNSTYSPIWRRLVARELADFRPDVVHVHNVFPLMSPSVYTACADAGVPVVQTLHNYRLVCPGAMLARDSHVCEECVGKKIAWPAVHHACYRDSRGATAATVAMISVHRAFGTWQQKVQAYIALTNFGRDKFVLGGLPADRIHVKPHFTRDRGIGDGEGRYFLFAGRLSAEKGILALLQAYRIGNISLPLRIVGTGPLNKEVAEACSRMPQVTWLGSVKPSEVRHLMKSATAVVCPSECYETLSMVAVESLSVGTPVVAPRLGVFPEVIQENETGLLYEAFNAKKLNEVLRFVSTYPAQMFDMRKRARISFESKYTAGASYTRLMQIYNIASQTLRM